MSTSSNKVEQQAATSNKDTATTTTTKVRYFQCKCGIFTLELHNEPLSLCHCHCHSCVSTARHIDKLYGTTNTSAVHTKSGGFALAFYNISDIHYCDEPGKDDASKEDEIIKKLDFGKVGNDGTNLRSYTKCCGTLVNTFGGVGHARPFNYNAIYEKKVVNDDHHRHNKDDEAATMSSTGTTTTMLTPAFQGKSDEYPNVFTFASFDPDTIPQPKYKIILWARLMSTLRVLNQHYRY